MSRTMELPEPVYRALRDVAEASDLAPAEWIAVRVSVPAEAGAEPPARTPAELRRLEQIQVENRMLKQ